MFEWGPGVSALAVEVRPRSSRADGLPSSSSTSFAIGRTVPPVTITPGVFGLNPADLGFPHEVRVRLYSFANPSAWVEAPVLSYDSPSGVLTLREADYDPAQEGAGPFSDWVVTMGALYFSDRELITRPFPEDVPGALPHTVAVLSGISHERRMFSTSDGWPVVGGESFVDGGVVALNNGDGRLDGWRHLSLDEAELVVREFFAVRTADGGWGPCPVSESVEWFRGVSRGRPSVTTERVEFAATDLREKLAGSVRTRKMEGLGGCVVGDPSGGSYGEIAHDSAHNVTNVTVVMLVRPHSDDVSGGRVAVSKGDVSTSPFILRCNGGFLLARINTGAGNLTATAGAPSADEWYWFAATYTNNGHLRVMSQPLGGVFTDYGDSASTAGTLVTNTSPIQTGRFAATGAAGRWKGGLAHLRIYNRVLTPAEVEASLRPLDLEDADDTNGLISYVELGERFGDLSIDPWTGRDCQLFSYSWGTTGTGRPDQRGQWFPLALGRGWVPCTKVDELPTGSVYAVNWRNVQKWVFVVAAGVGLVPTLSRSSSGGCVFDSVKRTIKAPAGDPSLFEGLVPNQQFTISGTTKNNATFTVDGEAVWPGKVRVVEALSAETSTLSFVSVSPSWSILQTGSASKPSLVLVTGSHSEPVWALVEGDNSGALGYADTVQEHLQVLVTECGPGIAAASIDFSRLDPTRGAYVSNLYQGTDPEELAEVVFRVARSIGAYVGSEDGSSLSFGTVEILPAGDPVDTFLDEEVEDLESVKVARLPSEVVVGYGRVASPATGDQLVAGAWTTVAETLREEWRKKSTALVGVENGWPSAAPADMIETTLSKPRQARAESVRRAAEVQASAWRIELSRGADSLAAGDKIRVYYHRHGFASGRDVVVVGIEKNPGEERFTVYALLPPDEGAEF